MLSDAVTGGGNPEHWVHLNRAAGTQRELNQVARYRYVFLPLAAAGVILMGIRPFADGAVPARAETVAYDVRGLAVTLAPEATILMARL